MGKSYVAINTERLFLRPFFISDAKEVQVLAGDKKVSRTLFTFDPSKDGVAERWIIDQYDHFEKGEWINLAITEGHLCTLIGSVGLEIEQKNNNAELVYWLGKDHWGQGYATEAARAIIGYGFDELRLHRIYARYFSHNLASGRVLEKLGMTHEGRFHEHFKKFGVYEDIEMAGLLEEEFRELQRVGNLYRL